MCEHEDFTSQVNVSRLTKAEEGPVIGYAADVTVNCAQCGLAFVWVGLPAGSAVDHPTTSVDRAELRAPIRPATASMQYQRMHPHGKGN